MAALSKISIGVVLLCLVLLAIYTLRPPGETPIPQGEHAVLIQEVWIESGQLPGITWADDIHPIFIRNNCGNCHTRGQEDVVEGLNQFSLGIIDPENAANPYFSYREFVYTQGAPLIMDGETLRDGQCCWPKGFPADQQRRIWLGHPERSALLRKLERDYYNWNKPPRFFGEGLRLPWGLPMPLWQGGDPPENHATTVQEDHHGGQQEAHMEIGENKSTSQNTQGHGHEDSDYSTSIWNRIALRSILWFGGGRDQLMALPPRIPATDRAMLRYWITNSFQLQDDDTGIEITVVYQDNLPAVDEKIIFIGNFIFPGQQAIKETFIIRTDGTGKVTLNFKAGSVVSRFWYAGLAGNKREEYTKIAIEPGIIKRITIKQ